MSGVDVQFAVTVETDDDYSIFGPFPTVAAARAWVVADMTEHESSYEFTWLEDHEWGFQVEETHEASIQYVSRALIDPTN